MQNVQQVSVDGAGSYLVKVEQPLTASIPTNFAVALSHAGFKRMTLARLAIQCSAPRNTPLGYAFTLHCAIVNTGDLEAWGVKARVLASHVTGCTLNFGRIAGHSTTSTTCSLRGRTVADGPVTVLLEHYGTYEAWDILDPPPTTEVNVNVTQARPGYSAR
jgi:hypothetical protein